MAQGPEERHSLPRPGYFWGIAPGTPQRVVHERVNGVDNTIATAKEHLNERGVEEVGQPGGRRLFDRRDLERAAEFQDAMRERFAGDLELLGY